MSLFGILVSYKHFIPIIVLAVLERKQLEIVLLDQTFKKKLDWRIFWWLVRVILLVAFGFFALKFWEMVGTYELSFCSKRNTVVLTMLCVGDTQTLLDGLIKFWTLCIHRRWGCKQFPIFPSPSSSASASGHKSHLVKLSLPNICIVRYVNCAIDKVKDCPLGQLPPNMMEEMEKIKEQMTCWEWNGTVLFYDIWCRKVNRKWQIYDNDQSTDI